MKFWNSPSTLDKKYNILLRKHSLVHIFQVNLPSTKFCRIYADTAEHPSHHVYFKSANYFVNLRKTTKIMIFIFFIHFCVCLERRLSGDLTCINEVFSDLKYLFFRG